MDRTKWEYRKLGEVATFQRGLTYRREDEVDYSRNCVLRSNNIDLSTSTLCLDELKYVSDSLEIPADRMLKENSILICTSNGSKQHVGKVAYIDKQLNYAFGGFMGLIVPTNCIRGKYLYYTCLSAPYKNFLQSIGNGIGITNLRFSDLSNFSIIVPPLPDQQTIVSELDKLNEVMALKRKQLSDLDSLAQSLFYEMFGDPVENEKGWEVKKLKALFKVTSSKRILQSEWQCNGVPFYKVADIIGLINHEDVSPSTFIRESDFDTLREQGLVPKSGDLLITSRGTLGQCYIITDSDKFYFQDGMITWLSQKDNNILPIYVKCLFGVRSFMDSLLHTTNMSTVAYLSISQLANKTIPLPPLPLQQSFSTKVAAIESEKQRVKASLKDLETLLASRMQYWFG